MNVPYPLPTRQPYTGERVKELFHAAGTAISAWAEANGYTRHQVYMVINGEFKGRRGTSHEIALKLGMKLSVEQLAA
ncbi:DNA-binding protein [Pseudomonas aeruginosa]|uniref:DNA-binding protein n=1 Tax=Pseudomonas aeruginosa TaxID=287 RepID=UPI00053DE6BB|nr:DNA-binding protein [Pseudomonas aeruginosa]MBA4897714.1 DNA-binding protein [Pseudomonas aeruginosa]MCV6209574.1 DNA-binding protein [Pseudomonas aeruginosa]